MNNCPHLSDRVVPVGTDDPHYLCVDCHKHFMTHPDYDTMYKLCDIKETVYGYPISDHFNKTPGVVEFDGRSKNSIIIHYHNLIERREIHEPVGDSRPLETIYKAQKVTTVTPCNLNDHYMSAWRNKDRHSKIISLLTGLIIQHPSMVVTNEYRSPRDHKTQGLWPWTNEEVQIHMHNLKHTG